MPTPTSISINAGNNQTTVALATVAVALKVLVLDETNTPLPGASVTWVLPTTGARGTFPGPLSTDTSIADGSGIATAPAITVNATTGIWNPVAKLTANTGIQVAFSLANAASAPVRAATLVIIAGNNQHSNPGFAFTTLLQVRALDVYGNPVASSSVRFNIGSGNRAQFPGPTSSFTTTTDANGYAIADVLTCTSKTGSFSVDAQDLTGTAPNVTFNLFNDAGSPPVVPTTLIPVSGTVKLGYINQAFVTPIQARVVDQYGTNFPGASVTFSLPVGYASFPGGQTSVQVSDASGLVTSPTITAGAAAGGYVCTISTPGVTSITTMLTNVDPAVAVSLIYLSGSGQATTASTAFANPLRIMVADGLGGPVSGVNVTFTAPGASASCTMGGSNVQVVASAVSTGIAATSTPIANATNGTYNVVASKSGLTSVTMSLTNGAAPPVTEVSRALQFDCH